MLSGTCRQSDIDLGADADPTMTRTMHQGGCEGRRNRTVGRVDYKTIPLKGTAITPHRDPIFLSTFTGRPPDGCSYRIAVASMKKAYPGHAKRVMMGVWPFLRQFMYTKWVIVVDDDIDCRNWKDVMWAISTRMDPVRDLTLVEGTPIDYLDFASPESGLGGKVGMDATNKWPPETKREWGQQLRMD
jgi:3-polyprenyl-4-hydroxybenzoate decarboxylase